MDELFEREIDASELPEEPEPDPTACPACGSHAIQDGLCFECFTEV